MKQENIQSHLYIKVTCNYYNFDKCGNSYRVKTNGKQLISNRAAWDDINTFYTRVNNII